MISLDNLKKRSYGPVQKYCPIEQILPARILLHFSLPGPSFPQLQNVKDKALTVHYFLKFFVSQKVALKVQALSRERINY